MKYFSLFPLMAFLFCGLNEAAAQASQSFENRATTLAATSTPGQYVDQGNQLVAHELLDYVNGPVDIPVSSPPSSSIIGFRSFFRPSRTGSSNTGLTDGDIFGYAKGDAAAAVGVAPSDGSQVFFIEDTDGEVTLLFEPVSLAGVNAVFTMDFVVDGGFESSDGANDRVYIRLDVSGCPAATSLSLLDTDGGGSGGGNGNDLDAAMINGTTILDKTWYTITQDLAAYTDCNAQLVIEVDFNANTEESAFDNINFSAGVALPVELIRFTASQDKDHVMLDWSTANEIDNRGFSVERSTDGISFLPIGWVGGRGDTREQLSYQFEDHDVLAGQDYYYRLRQEDYDGSFTYSKIVNINLSGVNDENLNIRVYPNPTNNGLTNIEISPEKDGNWLVAIFDANGRVVVESKHQLSARYQVLPIDLSAQPFGTYLLRLVGQNQVLSRRIIR